MLNDVKNLAYEVEVNHRGQIMIPAFFREVLELSPKDQLRMTLKANGTIELQKIINNIPVSFILKFNPELRENVFEAYESMKNGHAKGGEELKQKLFGEVDANEQTKA
jgi:bifunctional DNA-binding transcriptional regulator/antitoxin component of YhaV-PrlF toxin-antitoxin module